MIRRLTPLQLGIDLGIAAVFAVVFVGVAVGTTDYATMGYGPGGLGPFGVGPRGLFGGRLVEAAAVLFPLLLAGGLGLRRLSPALALAAAWAGVLVQMAATFPPGWADVAVLAVLFATAAFGDRTTYWAGFVSAIVGAVAMTVYLTGLVLGIPFTLGGLIVVGMVFVAGLFALLLAWTAGALVRSRVQTQVERRTAAAATAESVAASERERIARDMHDVVGHSLAVVIAQADGARYAAASDPSAATEALTTISSTARAALADVRLLLTQLRHRQGDGPQPTLADLDELYAQVRAAGVDLEVEVDPAPPGVPPAGVQLAVYRILQESLTNALRHGGGSPVWVRLSWLADRVEIAVRNRIPVGASVAAAGHGLVGLGERASLAGGELTAGEQGDQFVVAASLPIQAPR